MSRILDAYDFVAAQAVAAEEKDGDEAMADRLRDVCDVLWRALSDDDRAALRRRSDHDAVTARADEPTVQAKR